MEERSKCLQIEVEGELPAILTEATTEVVNFDNHKENSLPRPPRFISRFHPSHASTSDLNGLEASSLSASKTMEAHNEDLKETKPGMTINHQRKTSLPMPTSPIDHMIADPTSSSSDNNKNAMPVDRYFAALEGPELETLRSQEEIVLPSEQTWPFLLRFPISTFGVCLGVGSQAIMWKTLATAKPTKFLHVSLWIHRSLWFISVALVLIIATIYLLKIILYFEAVRREYYHPIRINFFFAPFISLLFLALAVPPFIVTDLPQFLWYVLMFPFICLELKIYGQWMSGGQRRLSRVANPTNHLAIVGNFVGALLGARMGLREGPIFFFTVGMAHYLVLFVTLYQRLPTNETLPKDLHPVFFLFVAAPSVASMAWATITGSFNYGSKVCYFIAMFLYFSLAVRINFFRGIKFSLSWWAYTFPMTGAAIATISYAAVVRNTMTKVLCVILCAIATLVVFALLVTTIIHVFVLGNLFPNDNAIAISNRPRSKQTNHHRWLEQFRNVSSETIENYLKFADSDSNDLEAAIDKIQENNSAQ
ncbi:hypothetical protein HID58_007636 [Brassica napus]|uniref:Uncharacterized protein n=1 Tax=Brassica napus TaxID=3708 RepID=A0ABQ8EEV3_BRANA|nr:hypothetical protein HID58_007636 [Brassica napus]